MNDSFDETDRRAAIAEIDPILLRVSELLATVDEAVIREAAWSLGMQNAQRYCQKCQRMFTNRKGFERYMAGYGGDPARPLCEECF